MTRMFTISPAEGWRVGDRAYCVEGTRCAHPSLEAGKVYVVSGVIPVSNCVGDGLNLEGVLAPDGIHGFWSSRFVKLRRGMRSIDQVARATTPAWMDAYRRNNGLGIHTVRRPKRPMACPTHNPNKGEA
ncbi:hypothetical protein [Novosphingobium sp. MBES04]|uniref:hypothetical protein n=1 Tax=Novosphingobium sp. MBES04 TaxID=1206458 RepID=UPI001186CD05|nr:hypothetical protein [Novosphingobium sp. MBES04]